MGTEVLDSFLGKIVVDITEHKETDFAKNNSTYIQISFDDDSFICFPRYENDSFWFSR